MMKTLYFLALSLFVTGTLSAQTVYFSDDFDPLGGGLTQNNLWTTQVVTASTSVYDWYHGDFSGDAYAKISNFNGTTITYEPMESWLISPVINLSTATAPNLNFNNVKRFPGTDAAVLLSTDYDGSSAPSSATWIDVTSSLNMDSDDASWSFVNSGSVDIASSITASPSTVYLAFQYVGGSSDGSTYQIDDVIIQEGTVVPPTIAIYDIQYTLDPGGVSTMNGSNVTALKGIVTAQSAGAFNVNDRGYWLQDGTGPWHGIFVLDSVNAPAIGDSVLLDGNVNENFSQTIVRNITSYAVLNSGNTLPAASAIATDSVNQEKYEGVLVTVNANCTNPSLGFGQWELNDGTGAAIIDDVMYEYLTPVMSTSYMVTGPVYYTFTEYKILPRGAVDVSISSGVEEISGLTNLYPNPATDKLTFSSNENGTVEVLNLMGEIVNSKSVVNGVNQLDVSVLSAGIYIVRLQGSSVSVKVIVQ
jgi:hypothetical protein